jgi:hypothetical protein
VSLARDGDVPDAGEFGPGRGREVELPGLVVVVLAVGTAEAAMNGSSAHAVLWKRPFVPKASKQAQTARLRDTHMYSESPKVTQVWPVLGGGTT